MAEPVLEENPLRKRQLQSQQQVQQQVGEVQQQLAQLHLAHAWEVMTDGAGRKYYQNQASEQVAWELPTTPKYQVLVREEGALGVELEPHPARDLGARVRHLVPGSLAACLGKIHV